MEDKKDVHGHAQRFLNWKRDVQEYGEDRLTKANTKFLTTYIFEMEQGLNVSKSAKKGGRSPAQLNKLRQRLSWIMRQLQERKVQNVTKISEKKLMEFFNDMRSGELRRKDGQKFQSVTDYVRVFKAFWHWHMKVNRKNGIMLPDITEDIDTRDPERTFVWLKKVEFDKIREYLDPLYQLITLFIFDSIIRSPTELLSMKAGNIFKDGDNVCFRVPEAISKSTYTRTSTLWLCGEQILEHIEKNNLTHNDYLFDIDYNHMKTQLQKVAKQIFKDSKTRAGGFYKDITPYDLRHSGAIHWRGIMEKTGQSEGLLMRRGGWTDLKMLNYYTKFLGTDGVLAKEKLILPEDKTKMERDLQEYKEMAHSAAQGLEILNKLLSRANTAKSFKDFQKISKNLNSKARALTDLK